MLKRILTPIAAMAVALATLTACGTPATSTNSPSAQVPSLSPGQKVQIVFESYNLTQAGAWSDTINGLLADFMAQYPNIKVTGQPTQGTSAGAAGIPSTIASVQTQLLAGNPPDVAQITFDAKNYAIQSVGAQNLSQLFGTSAVQAQFGGTYPYHDRAKTLGDLNGSTYGLPYVFSTPVLWYNATLLQKAGVPADADLSTWDGVEAAAKKVTAYLGKPGLVVACPIYGGNWCMQGIIRSNGGRVLSQDGTTLQFGQTEAIGAVQRMRELYDAGVLLNTDATSTYDSFAKQNTALMLQTSAVQGMLMQAAKQGGWTLKTAPMPGFPGKPVIPTNSGSMLMLFSKDPAKQAAAWELMKFMTSDHAYEMISTKIGYLPLRNGLTNPGAPLGAWAAANPLIQPNLDQLNQLEPWVSYPGDNFAKIDDILARAVEASVFYGADPKATLEDAQKRAQGLMP